MPELNFDELRAAVEDETFVPEFAEIRRRARRHKRWRVLVNAARVIGVLVIATPAFAIGDIVFTHIYNPQATQQHNADGGRTGRVQTVPTGGSSPAPYTRRVVAVDGIDAAHTYALEDVCSTNYCDLQLSQVNPTAADPASPAVGLLRNEPTDRIISPRIVVENTSLVIVSAIVNAGIRQSLPVTIDPAAGQISSTMRPVQTVVQGPIQFTKDGATQNTLTQPPVSQPELVSDQGGWWVCGITAANDLGVSVSHDGGKTWTVHSTGIPLDGGMPDGATGVALATMDGTDVYVLVHSYDQTTLARSTDGGATWWPIATSEVWPNSTAYNLVITKTGMLIASFSGPTTSYFVSNDHGATFQPMVGQPVASGLIVSAGGELITLGSTPSVSQDGINWQSAYVPYVTTQSDQQPTN